MKSPHQRTGFTLIELLVVISIIIIATTVLFVGVGGGGDGTKLSSSQRIVSSIAQGARGQAIIKNAKARLIIYTDAAANEDDEKKLRYVGTVYANPEDTDPSNPTWIASTQGVYLPEGIYFNEALSDNFPGTKMTINYPRISPQAEGSGEEYFYYEFNSNGTMGAEFVNSWLALQAGALKPDDGGNLEVTFDDLDKQALKAALIFRRVGTTTLVTDPSEIN